MLIDDSKFEKRPRAGSEASFNTAIEATLMPEETKEHEAAQTIVNLLSTISKNINVYNNSSRFWRSAENILVPIKYNFLVEELNKSQFSAHKKPGYLLHFLKTEIKSAEDRHAAKMTHQVTHKISKALFAWPCLGIGKADSTYGTQSKLVSILKDQGQEILKTTDIDKDKAFAEVPQAKYDSLIAQFGR